MFDSSLLSSLTLMQQASEERWLGLKVRLWEGCVDCNRCLDLESATTVSW
jgi:hypothetical protein